MGVIRAIGLIFIMTILIGGCILAAGPAPQTNASDRGPIQVSWEGVVKDLQNGEAVAIARTNLTLILLLKDGTLISAEAPSVSTIEEALARCGQVCKDLITKSI